MCIKVSIFLILFFVCWTHSRFSLMRVNALYLNCFLSGIIEEFNCWSLPWYPIYPCNITSFFCSEGQNRNLKNQTLPKRQTLRLCTSVTSSRWRLAIIPTGSTTRPRSEFARNTLRSTCSLPSSTGRWEIRSIYMYMYMYAWQNCTPSSCFHAASLVRHLGEGGSE